jgi:hypothetical protein
MQGSGFGLCAAGRGDRNAAGGVVSMRAVNEARPRGTAWAATETPFLDTHGPRQEPKQIVTQARGPPLTASPW